MKGLLMPELVERNILSGSGFGYYCRKKLKGRQLYPGNNSHIITPRQNIVRTLDGRNINHAAYAWLNLKSKQCPIYLMLWEGDYTQGVAVIPWERVNLTLVPDRQNPARDRYWVTNPLEVRPWEEVVL